MTTIDNELPVDAASDIPSKADIKFGSTVADIPQTRVTLDFASYQNQWITRTPSTAYACTCFSASHSSNISAGADVSDGVALWAMALNDGADINSGWWIQKAVHLAYSLGYITYARVDGLESFREAIYVRSPIATGSNMIDWNKTRANGWRVVRRSSPGAGHAFTIDGFDDEKRVLLARDSYGENSRIKGRFEISYDDIDILFTSYAVLPKDSYVKQALEERNKKTLAEAVERGVWNGENPKMNILRREAVLVIGRAKYPQFDDDRILALNIWNKERPEENATRREFVLMLMRTYESGSDDELLRKAYEEGVWNSARPNDSITRDEAVLMAMRKEYPYFA